MNQLFELGLGQQIQIGGLTWTGVTGLTGTEGALEGQGNLFSVNFGGGVGVSSIPEPSTIGLLLMGLVSLARRFVS